MLTYWLHLNKTWAIARHEFLWRVFEQADPLKWPKHMDAINRVYGE